MPLQFVAQGPMQLPAVGGGGVTFISLQGVGIAFWGAVSSGTSSTYVSVPSDCTLMVIVATLTGTANHNLLTWDFGGTNQALTEVGYNDNATFVTSIFGLLNPTPGNNLVLRHACTVGSGEGGTGVFLFKGNNPVLASALTGFVAPTGGTTPVAITTVAGSYVVGGCIGSSGTGKTFVPNGSGSVSGSVTDADCGYGPRTGATTNISVSGGTGSDWLWGMAVNP